MSKRVARHGLLGLYGVRYCWVCWAAIAVAFALLIVALFDDGSIWQYGVLVLVGIAVAVRPGGVRCPRAATAVDDVRAPGAR